MKTYYILSGEGDFGHWSGPFHTTERGIKNRATRASSNGDRWTMIFLRVPETVREREHLIRLNSNFELTGEYRDIPTIEEE